MLKKPKVLTDAYESYAGDGDRHRVRLSLIALIAILIAAYSKSLSDAALPAMALAVSVLAGFTFTALFSSGSLSAADLPKEENESDRAERKRLDSIITNFRVRARLFLLTAVLALLAILLISIRLDIALMAEHLTTLGVKPEANHASIAISIHQFSSKIMILLTFIIFLEMLYLFYRLSESVFSALDIRRNYLQAHQK